MRRHDDADTNAQGPESAASRRLADLTRLVRTWADQGTVDPRVAARFLQVRTTVETRRVLAWRASDGPRRRRDD
jgi:hypothetical protein